MSAIPSEVRERIISAANELYEQANRESFPTVDAVRRQSKADMNAVSMVMREWRQAQTVQAVPVAVSVPEEIQQAQASALAGIWLRATELANLNLQAAQTAWETERKELDGMRAELASSYETQAAETESFKRQLSEAQAQLESQANDFLIAQQDMIEAVKRAEKTESLNAEIDRHTNDLRVELGLAHAETERLRVELTGAQEKLAAELTTAKSDAETLRAELVKAQTKAEAQQEAQAKREQQADLETARLTQKLTQVEKALDTAITAAAEARERAAGITGQLEATQTQNAALLDAIKPKKQPAK